MQFVLLQTLSSNAIRISTTTKTTHTMPLTRRMSLASSSARTRTSIQSSLHCVRRSGISATRVKDTLLPSTVRFHGTLPDSADAEDHPHLRSGPSTEGELEEAVKYISGWVVRGLPRAPGQYCVEGHGCVHNTELVMRAPECRVSAQHTHTMNRTGIASPYILMRNSVPGVKLDRLLLDVVLAMQGDRLPSPDNPYLPECLRNMNALHTAKPVVQTFLRSVLAEIEALSTAEFIMCNHRRAYNRWIRSIHTSKWSSSRDRVRLSHPRQAWLLLMDR